MSTSIAQYVNRIGSKRDGKDLQALFTAVLADLTALKAAGTGSGAGTSLFNSGALVIHGSASALAKTVNTVWYQIAGATHSKAAADMAALSGTVTAAKFNVFVFYVDAAGTLTSAMGTEAATLAAVVFPVAPQTKATIGFVVINPTGTGDFVGGSTALDDGTVVPNAAYTNTVGSFNVGTAVTLSTVL